MNNIARSVYLDMACCSEEHAWQVPEAESVKWYDLLWLLIPIAGMALFVLAIELRAEDNNRP